MLAGKLRSFKGPPKSNLRSSTLNNSNVHDTMFCGFGNERLSFPCWCSAGSDGDIIQYNGKNSQKLRECQEFIHEPEMLVQQIIFMKCGPLTLKQANNGCCRSSLIPFSQTKVFTPSYQASQASSFCWGSSYLMSYHTASRSISWLHGRGVTGEDITEIILCSRKNVIIITHFFFFQFSRGLSQDVPAEDEERPGGVQQLHGAGGEDGVPGVCFSRRIISSLANHTDRWDPWGYGCISRIIDSLSEVLSFDPLLREIGPKWASSEQSVVGKCYKLLKERERTICQTIKRLSQNLSLISWSTSIKWEHES